MPRSKQKAAQLQDSLSETATPFKLYDLHVYMSMRTDLLFAAVYSLLIFRTHYLNDSRWI